MKARRVKLTINFFLTYLLTAAAMKFNDFGNEGFGDPSDFEVW